MPISIRLTICFFLIAASALFAHEPRSAIDDMPTVSALHAIKIPHLDLTKASFEDALDRLESEWKKHHPDHSFPIAVTDYTSADSHSAERGPRISLSLKNVSLATALGYISDLTGRRLKERHDLLQIDEVAWIQEDWYTRVYAVSRKVLQALGLDGEIEHDDVLPAFERIGLTLPEDWMVIALHEGKIIITARDHEHHIAYGILQLLEAGYQISSPENDE